MNVGHAKKEVPADPSPIGIERDAAAFHYSFLMPWDKAESQKQGPFDFFLVNISIFRSKGDQGKAS